MDLSQLDLNQLLALDALLSERSVSRAARRMYVTPSAMSRTFHRLQETFDDKLLVPANGRRMILTPLAEQIAGPVKNVFQRVKEITATRTNFDPATTKMSIAVSMSDYAALLLLPGLMHKISRVAPGLRLRVVPPDYTWIDRLEHGDVDVALIPERYSLPNYPKETLFCDDYCCIAWSKNRKVGSEISEEQFISLKHAAVRYEYVNVYEEDGLLQKQSGSTLDVRVVVPYFSLLPRAIVGTDLIGVLQTRLAVLYARQLPIKLIRPPLALPPITEVMQYQHYQDSNQGSVWFRGLLKELARAV